MKFTTQITHTTEINGVTVNLTFKPAEHIEAMSAKVGDKLALVYAVQDDNVDAEDLIGDCMGELYSLHRHSVTRQQAYKALGLDCHGVVDEDQTPDKDAVQLDCYAHGDQFWSVQGEGMQCRFDTARGAGVWVPDDCLRKQLDDDEKAGVDRRQHAIMYAKQFLEQYNAIVVGEVYGIVTEIYDECGGFISCDHCWGCVGAEGTEKEMKMQFEHACEVAA